MVAEDLYKPVSWMVNRKTLISDSLVLAFIYFVLGEMVETFRMPEFCPLKVDWNLYFGSG